MSESVKLRDDGYRIQIQRANGDWELFAEYKHAPGGDPDIGRRLVACYESCAGMVDPAKEIAELRAEVARLGRLVAGEYIRGRKHEQAARADTENAHIAALREQNAAIRAACIRALERTSMGAEAREIIELALATKEPTDV